MTSVPEISTYINAVIILLITRKSSWFIVPVITRSVTVFTLIPNSSSFVERVPASSRCTLIVPLSSAKAGKRTANIKKKRSNFFFIPYCLLVLIKSLCLFSDKSGRIIEKCILFFNYLITNIIAIFWICYCVYCFFVFYFKDRRLLDINTTNSLSRFACI